MCTDVELAIFAAIVDVYDCVSVAAGVEVVPVWPGAQAQSIAHRRTIAKRTLNDFNMIIPPIRYFVNNINKSVFLPVDTAFQPALKNAFFHYTSKAATLQEKTNGVSAENGGLFLWILSLAQQGSEVQKLLADRLAHLICQLVSFFKADPFGVHSLSGL